MVAVFTPSQVIMIGRRVVLSATVVSVSASFHMPMTVAPAVTWEYTAGVPEGEMLAGLELACTDATKSIDPAVLSEKSAEAAEWKSSPAAKTRLPLPSSVGAPSFVSAGPVPPEKRQSVTEVALQFCRRSYAAKTCA